MDVSRRSFVVGSAGVAGAALASSAAVAFADGVTVEQQGIESAAKGSAVPAWTQMNPQDESYAANTTDFSAIFSPIQVGHMMLKNRIVKASAGSDTLSRDSLEISQNMLDYYGRMADGGAALIIVEDGATSGFGMNPSG